MKIALCLPHGTATLRAGEREALALARTLAPDAPLAVLAAGATTPGAGFEEACAGAAEALFVADMRLAGGGPRRLGADLLLLGHSTDDGASGLVPAAIAEARQAIVLTRVTALVRGRDDATIEVTTHHAGDDVRLRLPLPAVLCVSAGETIAAAPGSSSAPPTAVPLDELGLDLSRFATAAPTPRHPRLHAVTVVSSAEELLGR